MKNAGMAGAVALVGIGLITIGLSNFANRAEAVPSAARKPLQSIAGFESDGDCAAEPEAWFAAEGEVLSCLSDTDPLPDAPFGDLDGDGVSDFLAWGSDVYWDPKRQEWEGDLPRLRTVDTTDGFAKQRVIPMEQSLLLWHSQAVGETDFHLTRAAIIDIDGDGRRDLVVLRNGNFGLAYFWHRNITGGDPLVADINRDGFVNAEDLGLLIASWTG